MNILKALPFIGMLFLVSTFLSCDEKDKATQEQEAQYIHQLFTEIEIMAKSTPCENATTWSFTSYGSKACGGPVGFIAYSKTIYTKLFLQKVAAYTAAQQKYNEKWRIVSDCSAPAQPIGVICENENPTFVY